MKDEILDEDVVNTKFEWAGFGLRLGAYLIDIIPIIIILNLLGYLLFGFNPFGGESKMVELYGLLFEESKIVRAIVRYLSFLVWIIYCAYMDASANQGSYGKSLSGIKVVDHNGNQLTLAKAMLRNGAKILSYLVLALGFIWVLFDKKKRGWHDLIARTSVIRTKRK